MICTSQSTAMQLSQQQQMELHELWNGINRARCDLVTAVDRLKEIEPATIVAQAALKIACSFVDSASTDINYKLNANLPVEGK